MISWLDPSYFSSSGCFDVIGFARMVKGKIALYRQKLDQTLASPNLTDRKKLKALVKDQIFGSSEDRNKGWHFLYQLLPPPPRKKLNAEFAALSANILSSRALKLQCFITVLIFLYSTMSNNLVPLVSLHYRWYWHGNWKKDSRSGKFPWDAWECFRKLCFARWGSPH